MTQFGLSIEAITFPCRADTLRVMPRIRVCVHYNHRQNYFDTACWLFPIEIQYKFSFQQMGERIFKTLGEV